MLLKLINWLILPTLILVTGLILGGFVDTVDIPDIFIYFCDIVFISSTAVFVWKVSRLFIGERNSRRDDN